MSAPASARPRRRRPPPSRSGGRARGRRRPSRRRYLVRRWAVAGAALGALALVYLVLFTPVLGVRAVEVRGLRELTADEVRVAAAVPSGEPLARLDTAEIADRVALMPRVDTVDVRRSLPDAVEITITERSPVVVVPAQDGVHLVDGEGVDYSVVPTAPPGLPTLQAVGPAATRVAVTVLAAVPPPLRPLVVSVTAQTLNDVRLTLADGRLVKWGGAQQSERKAAVLGPLLTQPGDVYDVAAPDFPTIS